MSLGLGVLGLGKAAPVGLGTAAYHCGPPPLLAAIAGLETAILHPWALERCSGTLIVPFLCLHQASSVLTVARQAPQANPRPENLCPYPGNMVQTVSAVR